MSSRTVRDLGLPMRMFGAELGELGGDVLPLGLQLRGRRHGVGRRALGHPRAAWAQTGARALAQRLHQRRVRCASELAALQLLAMLAAVGAGVGGVELDQHLAGLHRVAVLDEHALDDAGLERLQGLAAVADDDAARAPRRRCRSRRRSPRRRR